MNGAMKTLFYDGFFLPWAALDLPERSLIATLLIGFPVVYVYLTVRYRRLAAEALVTPHIAPISVKGCIAKQLGAREAALILSAHLSAITETFREAKQSSKTAHGEVIALLSEFFGFHPKIELGPAKIEEELVIKVGALELPIGAMVNLLIALSRVVYVPNRRNYLRAQIHVSLVSSETDTQLIVSRGWPYAGSSQRSS